MKAVKSKIKSRRGVTLSEVLVTVAILGMLLPSIMVTFFSTLDVYTRTKYIADVSVLSANLENAITNQLAYGYNTQVSVDKTTVSFEKYGSESVAFKTAPDGDISVLYMNTKPLYDVEYYDGISTSATFTASGGVVTVKLAFSGRVKYETSFTVRPLSVSST